MIFSILDFLFSSFLYKIYRDCGGMCKLQAFVRLIYIHTKLSVVMATAGTNCVVCVYVTANLRNQLFPGIPNPFRESGESLK